MSENDQKDPAGDIADPADEKRVPLTVEEKPVEKTTVTETVTETEPVVTTED